MSVQFFYGSSDGYKPTGVRWPLETFRGLKWFGSEPIGAFEKEAAEILIEGIKQWLIESSYVPITIPDPPKWTQFMNFKCLS